MSSWEDKYKNVSKTSEAVLMLVNASVEIITPIFAGQISHINKLIDMDNMEALKKRHPVLTDDFREYSALLTSLNTMSSGVSRMEYLRKSLHLLVAGKSKFDDKARAHITKKTEGFESYLADFTATSKVATHAVEFFGNRERVAKGESAAEKSIKGETGNTEKAGKGVSSLKELARKLSDIISKIDDRSVSDARSATKEIQRVISSPSSAVTGSAGEPASDNEHLVKVGGFDDGDDVLEFVGGGNTAAGVASRSRKLQRVRADLQEGSFGIHGGAEEYGKKVIAPTVQRMYPGDLSPKELTELSSDYLTEYFRDLDKISEVLDEQLRAVKDSGILEKLRGYLAKHYKQYLDKDIDEREVPEVPEVYDNSDRVTTLEKILKFSDDVGKLLSDIDNKILKKYVKRTLANTEEYESLLDRIEVYDREPGPPVRVIAKREIRDAAKKLVNDVETLKKSRESTYRTADKAKKALAKDTDSSASSASSVGKLANFNEEIAGALSEEEAAYAKASASLQLLLAKWNDFISPERVDTCIRRVINYVAFPQALSKINTPRAKTLRESLKKKLEVDPSDLRDL